MYCPVCFGTFAEELPRESTLNYNFFRTDQLEVGSFSVYFGLKVVNFQLRAVKQTNKQFSTRMVEKFNQLTISFKQIVRLIPHHPETFWLPSLMWEHFYLGKERGNLFY